MIRGADEWIGSRSSAPKSTPVVLKRWEYTNVDIVVDLRNAGRQPSAGVIVEGPGEWLQGPWRRRRRSSPDDSEEAVCILVTRFERATGIPRGVSY